MAEKNNWTTEGAFSEYHDRVLRYIQTKVSSSQDAEDICSAVFMKVQSNLASYDPEKASFATWIYTIARNAVVDYRREAHQRISGRTEPLCEEILSTDDASDDLIKAETLEELARALEALPQREGDLIILHYYSGIDLKEIAMRMGLSYSSVKRLHAKALFSLRRHMLGSPK